MTLRADCARVLAVLKEGGERKPSVLGGMLGSRERADAAVAELLKRKLVRMRRRNGGPHCVLVRKRRTVRRSRRRYAGAQP